jgi:GMP synthase (glutamine-hydrolysing)
MVHPGSIVILDFGGQYAHLIGNRIRRLGAYSEIRVAETPAEELKDAAGIILSGGPQSVYEAGSPQADPKILELGIPVLGLCYGHQWLAQTLGGEVKPGKTKEYGSTALSTSGDSPLFAGLPEEFTVWMSHGDEVSTIPPGFRTVASTQACANAAMADEARCLYGIQFHIEVTHSEHGMEILEKFVRLCDPAPWAIGNFAGRIGAEVQKEVGERKVFMLVSGGVDSSVAFTLLNKVLGPERVQGLLVDTGLMRKGEVELIQKAFGDLGITNLHVEDASTEFFSKLEGAYEPEQKRKIIGDTFLAVQKRVSERMNLRIEDGWMLGQGTIYPDTIETGGTKHADHIKTHHNRVDAVQKMIEQGLVVEPLKELYKDEVRELGEELGLPAELVWRHPFPGPGLGVRILCAQEASEAPPAAAERMRAHGLPAFAPLPVRSVGVQGDGRTYRHAIALFQVQPCRVTPENLRLATVVPNGIDGTFDFNRVLLCTSHPEAPAFVFSPGYLTPERADLLREADDAVNRVMREADLYAHIWQFPVVLLPFGTRKGGQSVVLRPISSTDAMTANAFVLEEAVLRQMTDAILAIPGIDLVFLDLTNKPPATIEWE